MLGVLRIPHAKASGGATQGGESLAFVGDSILGEQQAPGVRKRRKAKLSMFAWQDEEEIDGGAGRMMAAPTVEDIMDERDKVELMAAVKTGSWSSLAFRAGHAGLRTRSRPAGNLSAYVAVNFIVT